MMTELPRDLWITIYDIQGEAQQAAEGDRPCRSIEDTWARLEKVLPEPYRSAPDLLAALTDIMREYRHIMGDDTAEIIAAYEALTKAHPTAPTRRAEGKP